MTKATANKQVLNAQEVIADVKAYSRKIYLAGLGVYGTTSQQRAKSYKEVVKTGTVIFKDLVKAGEGLEKKGQKLVDVQVKAANEQFSTVKATVNKQIAKLKTAAKKTIKADAKIVEKAAVKVQAKVAAKAPVKAAAKAPVKAAAKAPAKVAAKAPVAVTAPAAQA